jgi:tyrosyl-tRNA synthetase
MYHGEDASDQAERDFETQFSRRGVPEDIEDFHELQVRRAMREGLKMPTVIDFAVASGIADTRGAARRLVEQKAVRVDEQLVERWDQEIDPSIEHVIRAGRKIKRYMPTREG